ncbi:spore germination protein [Paenibacillus thermoaerophilus]|uniref:Spore germination protein n=1 Tax=Paenibacillus thermoaerophilus TaxID=1215385 RepID=A0ABW2V3X1_9BACL|nr:spore germination protein [Paenibacillus thermoaerophilus]TMV10412.1 spore germination protein [Paenibacillus thermoaerophilus]
MSLRAWLNRWFNRLGSESNRPGMREYAKSRPMPRQKAALNANHVLALFSPCGDVKHHVYSLKPDDPDSTVIFVYCEGLCDTQQMLNEVVLPALNQYYEIYGFSDVNLLSKATQLQLEWFQEDDWEKRAEQQIFEGRLILFIPALHALGSVDIASMPTRQPDDSHIDISVRGSRDCFVEEVATNIALIRKRIRSVTLASETIVIGERTKTKVGLMYLNDIANSNIIQEVRAQLRSVNIDGIFSATQLEELLSPSLSMFPLMVYTGRPDWAVNCLLNGRFVLLVEGTPAALIAPATLTMVLKTPEDNHISWFSASFGQSIRLLGLVVSLLLPAFWVSLLAHHQDQIPFFLLATITMNRLGIPLSITQEMFLALIFLEILREASVRLSPSIGSTLTVVGGLIIGDAAIRAGFLSPAIVVIGAITQVFGATIANVSLIGTVSTLRFFIFFLASLFGLYGFFLGVFILLIHLASLQSYGVPYLAPLSPPFFKDMAHVFLRMPWPWKKRRPSLLRPNDQTNQGDGAT